MMEREFSIECNGQKGQSGSHNPRVQIQIMHPWVMVLNLNLWSRDTVDRLTLTLTLVTLAPYAPAVRAACRRIQHVAGASASSIVAEGLLQWPTRLANGFSVRHAEQK